MRPANPAMTLMTLRMKDSTWATSPVAANEGDDNIIGVPIATMRPTILNCVELLIMRPSVKIVGCDLNISQNILMQIQHKQFQQKHKNFPYLSRTLHILQPIFKRT